MIRYYYFFGQSGQNLITGMDKTQNTEVENNKNGQLDGGTYEIIRNRLLKYSKDLDNRLNQLNEERKNVFGSIETKLVSTETITTEHNCTPADMIAIADNFIFGYNVHIGLKSEIKIADVFSIYTYSNHHFKQTNLSLIDNEQFKADCDNLYRYYKDTKFTKFAIIGVHLFMIFRVGKSPNDIKTFKWLIKEGKLEYIDNRSDHEYTFPDQHEFRWKRTKRDQHQTGKHPHISIEDKVFVETTEGDLTIKIENNTDTGQGIYAEPVEDPNQTLDDAEFYYALIGNLIVMKIRPYQEKKYRYFVFNYKLKEVRRIDSLEDSCVLLPDDQGIVFANGYYLQTGDYKVFDNEIKDMLFEQRLASPNGEDYMYIFFNKNVGTHILMSYNLIEQQVDNPIICNGFTFFENGEMCYFRKGVEAQRHHAIQIWQTPYMGHNYQTDAKTDSYLYKVGNKDIVKAMAECRELIILINKEDSYSGLYIDIAKKATDISDTYYWIGNEQAHNLKKPLNEIQASATSAIDEFEKVRRIKRNTQDKSKVVIEQADILVRKAKSIVLDNIDAFVKLLADLRKSRGEVISLKDLRYADIELIEKYDKELEDSTENVSSQCVDFLADEEALNPYIKKVEEVKSSINEIEKVIDANHAEKDINNVAGELEMLIEIVSNLKIEDATQTARIIDSISAIYSNFNQIRASLRRRRKDLILVEGRAEFNAQIKLIGQSIINYLDLCDIPEKTDEYLSKLMVQLEELEGKFTEFPEFIELIAEKREEVYNAFESKKISLIEARSRRANSLQQSAGRILKAIQNRIGRFKTVQEINGYYATDLMIEKVRDTIKNLMKLGDSVKADEVESRLKSVREDAVRQLKDRTELFVAGENIISFGKHQFTVNTQSLGLTMVLRNNEMYYHLTGTALFEKVNNHDFLATRDVWEQNLVSENNYVYRSEYLAYNALMSFDDEIVIQEDDENNEVEIRLDEMNDNQLLDYLKKFMAQRYNEGYIKGVHDFDAFNILKELIRIRAEADLLKYSTKARACAELYWWAYAGKENKKLLHGAIKGAGSVRKIFKSKNKFSETIAMLENGIRKMIEETALFDERIATEAAMYLFEELSRNDNYVMNGVAVALHNDFKNYLKNSNIEMEFNNSLNAVKDDIPATYRLIRSWLSAYVSNPPAEEQNLQENLFRIPELYPEFIDEVAVTILCNSFLQKNVIEVVMQTEIHGMNGSHRLIENQVYTLNYRKFMEKMKRYNETVVPKYNSYVQLKNSLIEDYEKQMRLNEFKPRVLSSFVRNRLINEVYLPLLGANLAKQIGAAGSSKRTDLMGMLLLISPPGYGKTTLMEYIANRLGVIFMKINGPAIGHSVVALDPSEAPNAAAREELNKLNLAFEMGDNVMIYVDDIQHCNPEFLQKFISLADAQRKVEGVYKGQPKTYDFRGKKVCIVMAGNPYTESGEKFRIPDMLANRADIYNLGDIIGDTADAFKMSYIENSMTSNPTLARLSAKSHKDLHGMIRLIQTGSQEGIEFEAQHSPEEISEYVSVLKKMLRIRDVLLNVNEQYIYSAAQADEYRVEPQFKLQGSYRNMNKLAERVYPIMNDDELQTLILSHYENESQTLTTGAEANFLKFKEMNNWLDNKEKQRWDEIKAEFKKRQKLKGFGENNQIAQVLVQLESLTSGLHGIRDVLKK